MFINLRNHSHYSLLRALPKVPALVKKAKQYNMTAVALTDYSNMYGAIEFYKSCEKEGLKPIIGVEFSLSLQDRIFQIVLLAKNEVGYKNLMRITSVVNMENPENPDQAGPVQGPAVAGPETGGAPPPPPPPPPI